VKKAEATEIIIDERVCLKKCMWQKQKRCCL